MRVSIEFWTARVTSLEEDWFEDQVNPGGRTRGI
jgi:hypothetical protein